MLLQKIAYHRGRQSLPAHLFVMHRNMRVNLVQAP
jgi:hypothetical protein